MKNRKIISLTVLIVAIALMGILGLSKAFVAAWQKENTIDNSLSAEIVDDAGTVFDYPYVNYTQLSDEEKRLHGWFNDDFIIPENKEFTYQQAVNKVGEAIKYLTGYTGHQKSPMVIELTNVNMFSLSRQLSEDCYNCRQIVPTESGELCISAIIDTTGQFWYIGYETTEHKFGGNAYKTELSQNVSEQLLETSLQFLQEINPTDRIVGYAVRKASSSLEDSADVEYSIALKTEDKNTLLFTLNDEYGLIYFSRYPEEIELDYLPLPE